MNVERPVSNIEWMQSVCFLHRIDWKRRRMKLPNYTLEHYKSRVVITWRSTWRKPGNNCNRSEHPRCRKRKAGPILAPLIFFGNLSDIAFRTFFSGKPDRFGRFQGESWRKARKRDILVERFQRSVRHCWLNVHHLWPLWPFGFFNFTVIVSLAWNRAFRPSTSKAPFTVNVISSPGTMFSKSRVLNLAI